MEVYFNAVKVTENVYWVGAIDWSIRNFHGYETGRGSTYNAFLVLDEKITLIDSVKGPFVGELLARIRSVIGDVTKIDYIVSNHAEPDHSGGLPATIEAIKPEKVFASPVGQKTLTAYYGDLGITPVKTGEAISIGKGNIAFVETKMLHWPDSMVSYIPEEKLLISNDIFGQNIASSARFADDFGDDGEFVKRIKEYFYNIILPYSPMVLKTLPVVEKLDIDMIAPDHGLIHRGEKAVRFIIDMYRNLAEQKPQQRALIFYDTMWQSTERMAYAACSGLEENGVPTRIMSVKHNHHSAVMTELADCGAVLAGSPTHNNTVLPLVAAQLTYMKGLRPLNRVGGAFGSYGWSGEAPKYLQEQLAAMNMDMPADPVKCNWAPDKDVFRACHELGKTVAETLKKKCQEG